MVHDTSQLEPAAVLTLFTREDNGTDPNSREMCVEISRWGDPASLNAQYVVQPYYVAANVSRFAAPAGALTHSFRWEPGRVAFRTTHGSSVVAEHDFTSGVPSAGGETVRMNLYVFGNGTSPLEKETEVVVERFEFLP